MTNRRRARRPHRLTAPGLATLLWPTQSLTKPVPSGGSGGGCLNGGTDAGVALCSAGGVENLPRPLAAWLGGGFKRIEIRWSSDLGEWVSGWRRPATNDYMYSALHVATHSMDVARCDGRLCRWSHVDDDACWPMGLGSSWTCEDKRVLVSRFAMTLLL